ncbi:CBL-interacting protein kinase 31 [Hondaea fermentalgiana]|uniref:CBL-interacting protein kinase 31 n=1 Tax=Hondaea fermentalgiana TaxID=2315210 RepID=A0A2R5GJW3_9STRA|nr:CBL-interacting protein kinase 31 [Hondaea fermentalgiana]|eukprot:GBG28933.1 CBL-interacting protein kinase 31 [Hondaea fermentalgiana]
MRLRNTMFFQGNLKVGRGGLIKARLTVASGPLQGANRNDREDANDLHSELHAAVEVGARVGKRLSSDRNSFASVCHGADLCAMPVPWVLRLSLRKVTNLRDDEFDKDDLLDNVQRNKTHTELHVGNSPKNRRLKVLKIGKNALGEEAVAALGFALSINDSLKILDIGGINRDDEKHNTVGPMGAMSLSYGIEHNTTLTDLSLWDTKIDTEPGLEYIRAAVKMRGKELHIEMEDRHLVDIDERQVTEAISKRNKEAKKRLLKKGDEDGFSSVISEAFAKMVFGNLLEFDDAMNLLRFTDSKDRTCRFMALTNNNTRAWAKAFGMYLGRFEIGRAIHESKTCSVFFATDINDNASVALKLLEEKKHFLAEIEARKKNPSGCLQLLNNDTGIADALANDLCLVMPRGSKSLFEAINTERFAGHNLDKVREISYEPAKSSMFSDHENGHLRRKPPGQKRPSSRSADYEDFILIDLDASAKVNEEISDKASTGYVAPETARWFFRDELTSSGTTSRPIASAAMDIWSFGVMLFQLLTGTKLFQVDEADDNLVHASDKLELANWLTISKERLDRIGSSLKCSSAECAAARDLVRMCLQGVATERIEMSELLYHPFFDKMREPPGQDVQLAHGKVAWVDQPARRLPVGRTGMPRRIISLHRRIVPRRFSLFRKSQHDGSMTDLTSDQIANRDDRDEIIEIPAYHFFLSHMQIEASGIVKDLLLGLERISLSAWVDMRSSDLTLRGMHRGVLDSENFVMVLTKNVLFRPFCLIELMYAVNHFSGGDATNSNRLKQRIFFVVEEDSRFYSWSAKDDVPWTHETPHPRKGDVDKLYQDLENMKTLFGIESPEDLLNKVQVAVEHCSKIPYRRRMFEEDAMLAALASAAGLKGPRIEELPMQRKDALSLAVVCQKKSSVGKELRNLIQLHLGAAPEKSIVKANVILVLLDPYCEGEVYASLSKDQVRENLENHSARLLAVQNGWFAYVKDRSKQPKVEGSIGSKDNDAQEPFWSDGYGQQLRDWLTGDLEVLTWRGKRDDPTFINEHERNALGRELVHRAFKLLPTEINR